MKRIHLSDRSIIRITGEDSRSFLQGLISNDIARANGQHGLYAALLTPQGKYLFDFFIVADGDALLADCLAGDASELIKKLNMFKLRSKVTLEDTEPAYGVHVLFADGAENVLSNGQQKKTADGAILYADPRLAAAGVRVIAPKGADIAGLGAEQANDDEYQRHRMRLGLPEAPLDLEKDKSILLESGFDELSGVDWKKGCYMGQELTARTKYRGLIKKRLVPVTVEGTTEPGTDIMLDGKVVGDVRSLSGDIGMAMLRLQAITSGGPLQAGDATLTPAPPAWMHLPDADA
ncbi:folate-binding protein [Thalassospiraceae bacterium LMO-JJ14]|nr:folate-binding protein [Thalassospiraceae bacterium LMO-JJ14]